MADRRDTGRRVALIVTPRYLPILGGQERECALLAQEFARLGFQPVVVTEQLGHDTPLFEVDQHGARVHRIPSSYERTLKTQLSVAVRMALLVLRYRRSAAFAIVRTATLPALLVGLLKRLRLVAFPTLVTAETGGESDDVVALAQRPLFPLSRALVSGHDRLNGICQANVDHLREFGFPEGKVTFIPNGVDTSPWRSTKPPERIRRFLFLGRLDPEKGLFELLDAFKATLAEQDVWLTIAGEGPAREALAARAAELGLDDFVELAGRVPYEQLGDVFDAHDCMVLPSYSEGMPLSVIEGAAHHLPLIVTDVGDIRLMFGDRVRICPPRDTEALTTALKEAAADPAPRADYEQVIANVSIEAVVQRLLAALGVD